MWTESSSTSQIWARHKQALSLFHPSICSCCAILFLNHPLHVVATALSSCLFLPPFWWHSAIILVCPPVALTLLPFLASQTCSTLTHALFPCIIVSLLKPAHRLYLSTARLFADLFICCSASPSHVCVIFSQWNRVCSGTLHAAQPNWFSITDYLNLKQRKCWSKEKIKTKKKSNWKVTETLGRSKGNV